MSAPKPAGRQGPPPDTAPEQVNEVRPQTWADPGTWSASFKFLPAYVVLVGIFIAVYWNNLTKPGGLDVNDYEACMSGFNYTFPINAVWSEARDSSKSAKEIGWAYEATQEIFAPQRSVFGSDPFPNGKVPTLGLRLDEASIYIQKKTLGAGGKLLDEENVHDSSSAALGIAALQFGQKWSARSLLKSADRLKDILLKAPKYDKDAISYRLDQPEMRAEAPGLFAPFLAYFGVANDDLSLVEEAARQVREYREHLVISSGATKGLWQHAVGGSSDTGAWSTGNAVAAYGMSKLRTIIASWPKSNATMSKDVDDLDFWIQEILDAAIETDDDGSGLLRNYIGDSSWKGETSGTSLLAATTYRMAKIRPEVFGQPKYLDWAARKRRAVFDRVDDYGIISPAADPNDSVSNKPVHVSPEGESFVLILGTAWRDVVCSGKHSSVLDGYFEETQTAPAAPAAPITFESITGHSFAEFMQAYKEHLRRFYGMLWRRLKAAFESTTGYSVDALYAQAMEPIQRYAKYLSGPS